MAAAQSNPFTDKEMEEAKAAFDHIDLDHDMFLNVDEVIHVLAELKLDCSREKALKLISEVDVNHNGLVEYSEFMALAAQVKTGKGLSEFGHLMKEVKKLVAVKGAVGQHSFAEEEMTAFTEHINNCLAKDPDLDYLMPLRTTDLDLCRKVRDGVLLAKFINMAVPETIDERALNKKKEKLSLFQINENLNLVVASAKSIGVQVVNIGATELTQGEQFPHLVLGLVWQLVKIQLLGRIDLKNHPELIRLLEDGEELADLLRLPPEQILLRWFNYHLKAAGWPKRIANFSSDVKDGTAYTVLLSQIAPQTCNRDALADPDVTSRAEKVLVNARKLEVPTFIQPRDITTGNARLNLAFTAAIFNQCPGLDPISKEEMEKAGLMQDDFGDSREERAFRMWINSLAIPGLYINGLFEDCKDGLALLKVMDKVQPGIVDWKQVELKPGNKFKKVANCNYVVVLGKQMKFSLVGIGGSDIVDGNKKLLLALVWQLMRFHTLKFLAEVNKAKFGGKEVTDDMLVELANHTVQASGGHERMHNFKDPSLKTGLFFLAMLRAIEPRIIDQQYIVSEPNDEGCLLNAKYAISLARKLGAVVFLLPEDIVEVKPKMTLTFVASLLSIEKPH